VIENAAADSSPPTPDGGDAQGGSSQKPSHVDAAAASSPKTNFSRSEAIGKMMVLAGDADVAAEEKLENLDQLQPHYAELLGEDFTKALLSTTAKLIRGELKPASAKKYLEAL
jgi:hypothetical protein